MKFQHLKNALFLLLILSLISKTGYAQYQLPPIKAAEKIIKDTMIVALGDMTEKEIKKMAKKKPNVIKWYNERNEQLKRLLEEYWELTPLVFLPFEEAEKYWKKNQKDHTCFYFSNVDIDPREAQSKFVDMMSVHGRHGYQPGAAKVYLPRWSPKDSDIVYGIQVLQHIIKARLADPDNLRWKEKVRNSHHLLKEVTLLVVKENVPVITEMIPDYPYKYEVVEQAIIDVAILEEKPGYAYIQQLLSNKEKKNGFLIIGTEDAHIYYNEFLFLKIHDPRYFGYVGLK